MRGMAIVMVIERYVARRSATDSLSAAKALLWPSPVRLYRASSCDEWSPRRDADVTREERRWLVTGACGHLGGHVSDCTTTVRLFSAWAGDRASVRMARCGCWTCSTARNSAEFAKATGGWLLYPSSDFIWDGEAEGRYRETDIPRPRSVHGRTKLAGEQVVGDAGLVARFSWLYGTPVCPRATTWTRWSANLSQGNELTACVNGRFTVREMNCRTFANRRSHGRLRGVRVRPYAMGKASGRALRRRWVRWHFAPAGRTVLDDGSYEVVLPEGLRELVAARCRYQRGNRELCELPSTDLPFPDAKARVTRSCRSACRCRIAGRRRDSARPWSGLANRVARTPVMALRLPARNLVAATGLQYAGIAWIVAHC
jgi:RmlD substrate binding domain